MGVGKNEQPPASMGSSRLGRAETIPFRIEPETGKVGQHVAQAGESEWGHVFNEDGGGADRSDDAGELRPEPSTVGCAPARARAAVRLARESSADHINASCSFIDLPHVAVAGGGGPVASENAQRVFVALGLPGHGPEAAHLKAQFQAPPRR